MKELINKLRSFTKRQVIQYIIGMAIFTLGLSLMISTDLGPTSWDAGNIGISETFNISVGAATTLSGLILVLICAVVRKEFPNLLVIVAGLITGYFINFYLWVFYDQISSFDLYFRIPISIIGLLVTSFGINVYVKANVFPNPIDYFMVMLNENIKIPFGWAKLLTDIFGIIVALIFSGPIQVFTFINMVMLGVFVGYFEKVYYKYFEKQDN